ncbi:MAG: structural protein P5 [Rikenellaceae bacterium]
MSSRGLRNCNPGNIRRSVSRFQGEVAQSTDPEFKQFESIEWGYRAMFVIIHNYNELYAINTLDKIVARWAPPHENDTNGYVRSVAKRLGCMTTSHINSLDRDTMCQLVASMSWIENGIKAEVPEVEAGWELFAGS